jgi:hypothetical protein
MIRVRNLARLVNQKSCEVRKLFIHLLRYTWMLHREHNMIITVIKKSWSLWAASSWVNVSLSVWFLKAWIPMMGFFAKVLS